MKIIHQGEINVVADSGMDALMKILVGSQNIFGFVFQVCINVSEKILLV